MNTQHHFPNICVDKTVYDKVDNIKDFVRISREQSNLQTYYFSPPEYPERGSNKHFGDAGEYFTEILLNNSQIDKGINCSGWRPSVIDQFGIDGEGVFTIDGGEQKRLGTQTKISTDQSHYYNSENSNILAAVAAIPVFGFEGMLFVNFSNGINPKFLQMLNQRDPTLIRQLNFTELNQLTYQNTTFWDFFRDGLR